MLDGQGGFAEGSPDLRGFPAETLWSGGVVVNDDDGRGLYLSYVDLSDTLFDRISRQAGSRSLSSSAG